MIPILYESTETEFLTNGIGCLSDAISCTVEEERNGSYELEMEYPVDGIHFSDIENLRIISAVPYDGASRQPFDIYEVSKPLDGRVTIRARHISYRLSLIPTVSPTPETKSETAASALQRLKDEAIEDCPFDFWTDNEDAGEYSTPAPSSIRSRLGGTSGSILSVYGGEYEWDGFTVKLHKHRGSDTGVTLRYGKNISSIKQEESVENTVTGIMAYWAKQDESGEISDIVIADPVYADNYADYPYRMTMVLDCSQDYQDAPTVEELEAKATAYIKNNDVGVPKVNIDVSFVALWQTEEYKDIAALERVHLCDTVTVQFPALNVLAKAKVIKTKYDVLKECYDSIEIGDARTSLADTISSAITNAEESQELTMSYLQQAMVLSTKLIQGGLGGYVVFNTDDDGHPNEILIMDTADRNTATNVIRINLAGIGFSTSGYGGPFDTAWTIDGVFNADYINAGTVKASLVKGNLIVGDELHIYNSDGEDMFSVLDDKITATFGDAQDLIDELTADLDTYKNYMSGRIITGYITDADGNTSIGIAISQTLSLTGESQTIDGTEYYELEPTQTVGIYTSTGWEFWINGAKAGYFTSADSYLHVQQIDIADKTYFSGGGFEVASGTAGFWIKKV